MLLLTSEYPDVSYANFLLLPAVIFEEDECLDLSQFLVEAQTGWLMCGAIHGYLKLWSINSKMLMS